MRFKIELELKNENLSLDYRPAIISLFKHSLSVYDNGKHFKNYYEPGKDKPFTFAVNIPKSIFKRDRILVPSMKVDIIFSTSDMGTGIVFFNSLSMQKHKLYPLAYDNEITIKNIRIEKDIIIKTNTIDVIFKSPLCVRNHIKENNKDIYYYYEKDGFSDVLNKVLESQINKSSSLSTSTLNGFSMAPIECKKTVVKHHSQFIEATLGTFQLTGDIELLNCLYKGGMGSRKSGGFGLFEIIQ
jgi:CRISPR-associated endoribonuclease Cas6